MYEQIIGVAIHKRGITFVMDQGRHAWLIPDVYDFCGERVKINEQGFVTNLGRYLDRREAAALVMKTGQVNEETIEELKKFNVLVSEDLW